MVPATNPGAFACSMLALLEWEVNHRSDICFEYTSAWGGTERSVDCNLLRDDQIGNTHFQSQLVSGGTRTVGTKSTFICVFPIVI